MSLSIWPLEYKKVQQTLFKWTDADNRTRARVKGETRWGEGITHTAKGNGELCTSAYVHAYTTVLLAVFMDGAHGMYTEHPDAKLWQARGTVEKSDGTKVGCTSLTTVRVVVPPIITTAQKRAFAILSAEAVCSVLYENAHWYKHVWKPWADGWLAGVDQSKAAAAVAYAAACNASYAAAYADAAYYAAAYAASTYYAAAYAAAAAYAYGASKLSVDFAALAEKTVGYS